MLVSESYIWIIHTLYVHVRTCIVHVHHEIRHNLWLPIHRLVPVSIDVETRIN